jgi:hypothetical protein
LQPTVAGEPGDEGDVVAAECDVLSQPTGRSGRTAVWGNVDDQPDRAGAAGPVAPHGGNVHVMQ